MGPIWVAGWLVIGIVGTLHYLPRYMYIALFMVVTSIPTYVEAKVKFFFPPFLEDSKENST